MAELSVLAEGARQHDLSARKAGMYGSMSETVRSDQRSSCLWGAVETGLNVGIGSLGLEAGRAEVDHFHAAWVQTLKQDILWLQVAMYDAILPQDCQAFQDLQQ